MKRRTFSGDDEHRLPKAKVEPYRLWFEFLKCAHNYPGITVDRTVYEDWGDVSGADFDDWWREHWTTLFATKPLSRVIEKLEDFHAATSDPECVVMRVSLASSRKERMKDMDLVVRARSGLSRKSRMKSAGPAFVISSKRSINYRTLRGMLRYLQFFKDSDLNIDEASLAYWKWSKTWNDRVRTKRLDRPQVYVPPFLAKLVDLIDRKRAGTKTLTKAEQRDYDDLRNQARRMLRRGEKVLTNVGKGRFPGQF